MNAPRQIARDQLPAYIGDSDTSDGFDRADMIAFAVMAIEAYRGQYDLTQAIAAALRDRGATAAAEELLTTVDDTIWFECIGPMLDEIELWCTPAPAGTHPKGGNDR